MFHSTIAFGSILVALGRDGALDFYFLSIFVLSWGCSKVTSKADTLLTGVAKRKQQNFKFLSQKTIELY